MELVYLEWIDSDGSSAWQWKSNWVKRATRVKSVGWLIEEDEEAISITHSISPNPRDGDVQLLGYVTIPKVAVLVRKKMRPPHG